MNQITPDFAAEEINKIRESMHTAVIGKNRVVDLMIAALLCEGHVLIEDVPGVGKTSFISALASATGCSFGRIQFTPDVMPSDITGFSMPDIKTGEFRFRPGVIAKNIVLADEINRATAKTQSALLEAMEERQVTVDGRTYSLLRPFMVLATQNPKENVGTYPLPESQLDRFLMKFSVGYPSPAEEAQILTKYMSGDPRKSVPKVTDAETIVRLQQFTRNIHVADCIKEYIINIAAFTRESNETVFGVSPRGSLALMSAAQANAVMNARNYVTAGDVRDIASEVLSHRIAMTSEAMADGTSGGDIVARALDSVRVPNGGRI